MICCAGATNQTDSNGGIRVAAPMSVRMWFWAVDTLVQFMAADIIPISSWYSLKMNGERRASLDIRGTIGLSQEYREWGMEAAGTVLELEKELKELGDVSAIDLNIYSLGGYVWDALAIHDILVRHPARIEAHVDGLAASAATVILMAADTIEVPSNSYLMIHNAAGHVSGDHRDMIKSAEMLRKFSRDIANMYVSRIEDASDEPDRAALLVKILRMMDDETWLTGDEAVELGLADKSSAPVEIAAFAGSITNVRSVSEMINFARAPHAVRDLFDTSGDAEGKTSVSQNPTNLIMSDPIAPAPAAPSAPTPTPVASIAPAAPVASVAPVVPAAPVAPVASVAPVAPPAPVPVTMEAIAALIAPISAEVATLKANQENQQNLAAAGVNPTAWGNTPPVTGVASAAAGGDSAGPVNYAGVEPRALISAGRKAMHAKPTV